MASDDNQVASAGGGLEVVERQGLLGYPLVHIMAAAEAKGPRESMAADEKKTRGQRKDEADDSGYNQSWMMMLSCRCRFDPCHAFTHLMNGLLLLKARAMQAAVPPYLGPIASSGIAVSWHMMCWKTGK